MSVRAKPTMGEGASVGRQEALGISEGPAAPYLATPKQIRHSREGGNPERAWPIKRLGNFAQTSSGGTPKRDKPQFYGGSILWVKSGELRDGFVREAEESITQLGLDSSSAKVFPKGTLCIALYGATVGRLGILGIEAATNQAVCGIFPSEEVDTKYLFYFLFSKRSALIRDAKGGAQPNISQQIVRDLEVPVPSLAEQHRIVAELETQLTRLDASRTALKRVQANLRRYRTSVLKAACEGRLVPIEAELARREERSYEDATSAISHVTTPARPNRWNSRSRDIIPGHSALAVGSIGMPLPEGWAWSALVEIARMESGHTPSRGHPEWWIGDVPWIGIADARERDGRSIHDTIQHTNDDGLTNSAARRLPFGTVCVSRTASVGYVVVMAREMATSQDFVNWIPTPAVISDWLKVVFIADREALRRFGKGTVHKTIYFPEWLSIHVAIPPLAEQHRIVAEVERRLSVIDELEATVAANLKRGERLRQSVLERAFTEPLPAERLAAASAEIVATPAVRKPNRHFTRALLSAEIVHQLHAEATFGRIKHQKIFHLCEHVARISNIEGQYHREAAGPLDNKLIYANEAELKKQKWYEEVPSDYGHVYRPMSKAGSHKKYLAGYEPGQLSVVHKLIELMRRWTTERCEIFSTAYAAWNDLLLWGREPTEDAIIYEVLNRWHDRKRRITEDRWRKAIAWIGSEGYSPTGFGLPTAMPEDISRPAKDG